MQHEVLFLSYDEPNADENYARLLQKRPGAMRLHGVPGMYRAYHAASLIAQSDFFFLVDGDCGIDEAFSFEQLDFSPEPGKVYVWQSRNPINNLIYGYGGVKLISKGAFASLDPIAIDPLSGCADKFSLVRQVAGATLFNTSPFRAWRAAFRECCQLRHTSRFRTDASDAAARLNAWMFGGTDKGFGGWARTGAVEGAQFAEANMESPRLLAQINDFNWLKKVFTEKHGETNA
jgi:hypothetical protein